MPPAIRIYLTRRVASQTAIPPGCFGREIDCAGIMKMVMIGPFFGDNRVSDAEVVEASIQLKGRRDDEISGRSKPPMWQGALNGDRPLVNTSPLRKMLANPN